MLKSAARLRMFLLPLLAVFAPASVGANSASVPQRYTLDASASNVSAKVPFFGLASKTARFPRMEGAVTIVPGAPEKALIDVTFDATAIEAPDSVTLARLDLRLDRCRRIVAVHRDDPDAGLRSATLVGFADV